MRHVEPVWDTVVSLHLAGAAETDLEQAAVRIVAWVHEVDRVLSAFRADSDLARWQRGEIVLAQANPMLAEVMDLATQARDATDGAFDPLWSGVPDPTGLVKGWAIDHAARIAAAHGATSININAGGDVHASGGRPDGGPWRIGIEDPADATRTIEVVEGHDLCVATSGTLHRGEHVVRSPRAGAPIASVSVAGATLSWADAYSTAALALGTNAAALLTAIAPTWTSLVVHLDGTTWASAGWPGSQT